MPRRFKNVGAAQQRAILFQMMGDLQVVIGERPSAFAVLAYQTHRYAEQIRAALRTGTDDASCTEPRTSDPPPASPTPRFRARTRRRAARPHAKRPAQSH